MGGRWLPWRLQQWHLGPESEPWSERGHRALRGRAEDEEWIADTKLSHLVKITKTKSLEEIYLFSLPIKEGI